MNLNKENRSPLVSKPSTSSVAKSLTPSSNEVVNVAQRILTIKQTSGGDLVKNLKNRFESESNNSNQQEISLNQMTPKLIIKKFEQMSMMNTKSAENQVPSSSSSMQGPSSTRTPLVLLKQTSNTTSNMTTPSLHLHTINDQHNIKNERYHANSNPTSSIDEMSSRPKSIIEKFESLMKTNNCSKDDDMNSKKKLSTSTTNGSSLTYISSMTNEITYDASNNDYDEEEDEQDETAQEYHDVDQSEAIYEEVDNQTRDGRSLETTDQTSLFEMDDKESIDASSYTGSLMTTDDFETEAEETEQETDYYQSESEVFSNEQDETLQQQHHQPQQHSSNINNQLNSQEEEQQPPLFSIKEYRKQKRRFNGRRSSVMPRASLAPQNIHPPTSAIPNSKTNISGSGAASTAAIVKACEEKKSKYLERIKELDEMVKQEDNIIYQTGIALERCINDVNFTGSSEHVECNRILLISCQKRQAYQTEINRFKQLIVNLNASKKLNSTSSSSSSSSSSAASSPASSALNLDGDETTNDLTGLLIFSDIQLPIKESYINKLKSGDEKRLFYFLCLIRNGIQVLQTQVISVHELIHTRDTSITFPNRMAINNVDINFRVKIDIYAMEVLPKTVKSNVSTTHKFFSPFKLHGYCNEASLPNNSTKSSNFIHVDTVEITKKDIYTNKFKLSISSSSIPLTGLIFVNVRCMPSKSIELKGFMTIFEDISGMGSWDRRWCFLNNYNISYWKYPEDEYRNGALGLINLTKCLNEKVSILPRDLCARKYTIELICEDNENEDKTKTKRYRLSADTKEQVNDWLTNINYALANLRLWNPKPAAVSSK
jgi:actin-binding protein anillin